MLIELLLDKTGSPTSLYVAKSNHEANVFYEKYGFRITKEIETTYNNKFVLANEMIRDKGSSQSNQQGNSRL